MRDFLTWFYDSEKCVLKRELIEPFLHVLSLVDHEDDACLHLDSSDVYPYRLFLHATLLPALLRLQLWHVMYIVFALPCI